MVNGNAVGMTACQVRMARAGLRWSVEELARRSDVSEKTIRRIEKVWGFPPNMTLDTLNKLRMCFESHGMTLMPEDGSPEGPGVRYGRYPGRVIAAKGERAKVAEFGAFDRGAPTLAKSSARLIGSLACERARSAVQGRVRSGRGAAPNFAARS